MSDEPRRYSFEIAPVAESHRAREQALEDLHTLLAHLHADPQQIPDLCAARLLVRFAMDVPMNIAWYERAKKRALARQRLGIFAVIAFALAAMVFTAAPALLGAADSDAPIAITQVAIFVAMGYGVLQVIATLTDQKAKIAGFAKASADLKEALFTFEETWRKKELWCEGGLAPDFATALLQEVANARRVAREERDAFFAAGSSPVELASTFGGAIEAVGRNAQTLGELRRARADMAEAAKANTTATIASERQRLIETKAFVASRRAKLERLAAGGTEEELAAARKELLEAEIAEVEAQARFDMCIKGDMLNPR